MAIRDKKQKRIAKAQVTLSCDVDSAAKAQVMQYCDADGIPKAQVMRYCDVDNNAIVPVKQ